MTTETVRVLAKVTARPETIDEVKFLLLDLVQETRKERGCISYHLLQNKADPCDFTFVEEWENDADIDNHFLTTHVQEAFKKAAGLLASAPEIRRYSAIG